MMNIRALLKLLLVVATVGVAAIAWGNVRNAQARRRAEQAPRPQRAEAPTPAPTISTAPSVAAPVDAAETADSPAPPARLPRSLVVAAAIAIMLPVLAASPRFGGENSLAAPQLAASVVETDDGSVIIVRGTDFTPGNTVKIELSDLEGSGIVATASDSGEVIASIPLGAHAGHDMSAGGMNHELVASDGLVQAVLSVSATPGSTSGGDAGTAGAITTAACFPSDVAMGALPGQPLPVFCNTFNTGATTFVSGGNAWLDDFNHGLSMAEMGPGYLLYERLWDRDPSEGCSPTSTVCQNIGSLNQCKHWRHGNHWMTDVNGVDQDGPGPWNMGICAMRPDRSFRFETRTWTSPNWGITRTEPMIVVEADVAAAIDEYGGSVWPELVVTSAGAPTWNRRDGIYTYDTFAGYDTVGCRLQPERSPICAEFDNSTRGPGEGGRQWEISHFQNEASGGLPQWGGWMDPSSNAPWRRCVGTDPDVNCRDRFRWELSKTRSAIYVNGVLYMEHSLDGKPLFDRFMNSDVYVYFGQGIFKPDAATARFHWDRIAVNPSGSVQPPAPASTPTTGASPTAVVSPTVAPSATATRAASVTPTRTATATQTATKTVATTAPSPNPTTTQGSMTINFNDLNDVNRSMAGQYPSSVIDWGRDAWYLSGPWGKFKTPSISFDGSGMRSASFTFLRPTHLVSVQAFNGGLAGSSVTLSCDGNTTRQGKVGPGSTNTIRVNWTKPCTKVTVTSTNGWNTNFDNIAVSLSDSGTPAVPQTPAPPSPTAPASTPPATSTAAPAPSSTSAPAPTSTMAPAPTSTAVPAPSATPRTGNCFPSDVAMGALPGQPLPVFCNTFNTGATTFVSGGNAWLDDFNHGLSMAEMGPGYLLYEKLWDRDPSEGCSPTSTVCRDIGSLNQCKHWRHGNHWMTDVNGVDQDGPGPWNMGICAMRPDRSFRFETRTWTSPNWGITRTEPMIVVEADVAAAIDEYGGSVWPELVVTSAGAPTWNRRDGIYTYDTFAGYDTVGCRLQPERSPICAEFDNSTRGPGEGGRQWEISHFQNEASGGLPQWGGWMDPSSNAPWRRCVGTDPDVNCRDRFRWELSKTRSAIYVNGVLYMEHSLDGKPLFDRFMNSDVYVYFGQGIFKPDAATARFHWDRIAVNP